MIKVSFTGLRERLQTLDRRLYRCDDRERGVVLLTQEEASWHAPGVNAAVSG